MKMSSEMFQELRLACEPLNTSANRERYRRGEFPRADRVKDVDKRFRWDVVYAARVNLQPYYAAGLNDVHIDTALRRIIALLSE